VTERERFDVVLEELGLLLSRLGWLCDVVLIGGQALAVEKKMAKKSTHRILCWCARSRSRPSLAPARAKMSLP
jgi:hypothetical protein